MLALRMQHGCVSLVTTYISLLKEAKGQYYVILTELENSVGLILILRKRFCKNQWHYPLAAFVLLNFHSLDLFPSWFIFEYTIMFIHICTCGLWSPIRIFGSNYMFRTMNYRSPLLDCLIQAATHFTIQDKQVWAFFH